MSQFRNGVSAIHARVSRSMWREIWPGRSADEVPIHHVTNGVHAASWLAVPMTELYRRYLGEDWLQQMCDPHTWAAVDRIDDVEFWEQQQILKAHLVAYVRRCVRARSSCGASAHRLPTGRPSAVWIHRFSRSVSPDVLPSTNEPTFSFRIWIAWIGSSITPKADPNHLRRQSTPADGRGRELVKKVFQVTRDRRFAGGLFLSRTRTST